MFDSRLCLSHSNVGKWSSQWNVGLCLSHCGIGLCTSHCDNGLSSSDNDIWNVSQIMMRNIGIVRHLEILLTF
jgi:hypothetical protein